MTWAIPLVWDTQECYCLSSLIMVLSHALTENKHQYGAGIKRGILWLAVTALAIGCLAALVEIERFTDPNSQVLRAILYIVAIYIFIRLGRQWNWSLPKDKTKRGSCWVIILTVIGWAYLAEGTIWTAQEIYKLTQETNLKSNWKDGATPIPLYWAIWISWSALDLLLKLLSSFVAGLLFLFAAHILRSLEDTFKGFKFAPLPIAGWKVIYVEKDSPSVPPHEIELKDGIKDRQGKQGDA